MLEKNAPACQVDQTIIDTYLNQIPGPLFPVSMVHKEIHIHIPKTAGTSIRKALFGSEVIKHVKAEEINIELWENLPSLTVVWHPLQRSISSYKYHVLSGYRGILFKRHPDLKSLSLENYSERFVEKSALLESQKKYVSRLDNKKSTVDHIIRFEESTTELPRLLDALNLSVKRLSKSR